ncbi:MAG: FAD-binding oxidoreductase, partial [Gammaproteobacteria bacterium]
GIRIRNEEPSNAGRLARYSYPMTPTETDYLVIGGGIAGLSTAYELAPFGRVCVLERESHLAYHSTGRSAALFTESYGNAVVRGLAIASGTFFRTPPEGFADFPLLQPRGCLFIAREDQLPALNAMHQELNDTGTPMELVDAKDALARVPALRPEYVRAGLYEAGAYDIDVELLLRGYVRGLKARGGKVEQGITVLAANYRGGLWHLSTDRGDYTAPVLVNAAGAWADEFAQLASVAPLGLVPMRRTAATVPSAPHSDINHWPATMDIDEEFYFKPEGGHILVCPADETPSPACDAMPEDLDVAVAVDRVQRAADFDVPRLIRQWAGLRTFAPDRSLVVGFEPQADGFFWVAGQGGYGVLTCAAAARAAAAVITRQEWPADLSALGLQPGQLGAERLRA